MEEVRISDFVSSMQKIKRRKNCYGRRKGDETKKRK
jgi:hypothetical protein